MADILIAKAGAICNIYRPWYKRDEDRPKLVEVIGENGVAALERIGHAAWDRCTHAPIEHFERLLRAELRRGAAHVGA